MVQTCIMFLPKDKNLKKKMQVEEIHTKLYCTSHYLQSTENSSTFLKQKKSASFSFTLLHVQQYI